MPQASDELRNQWYGADDEATSYLEAKGYVLTQDGRWEWILPTKTHEPTEREHSAIRYMIDEYDYGGIAPVEQASETLAYKRPRMPETTQYALALLSEEAAEIIKMAAGKSFRFGFHTPGKMKDGEPDFRSTPYAELQQKCGDMLAAISFACRVSVLDQGVIEQAKSKKLVKLYYGHDNLGRPLSPVRLDISENFATVQKPYHTYVIASVAELTDEQVQKVKRYIDLLSLGGKPLSRWERIKQWWRQSTR